MRHKEGIRFFYFIIFMNSVNCFNLYVYINKTSSKGATTAVNNNNEKKKKIDLEKYKKK